MKAVGWASIQAHNISRDPADPSREGIPTHRAASQYR